MSTMNTYTGKQFDPMLMTEENVSLRDIAHALSLLCRGGRTGDLLLFGRTAQCELCQGSQGTWMVR